MPFDRELFVERQARFQFGSEARPQRPLDEAIRYETHRRGSLFMAWDPETSALLPDERWDGITRVDGRWRAETRAGKIHRNVDLLNQLHEVGVRAPVLADMQDGVAIGVERGPDYPVFQYNRVRGATNTMLWPLKGFQDIG